ncbi:MAG: flagellar motor switch protein FliG, partial [Nitrospinota bacterium]
MNPERLTGPEKAAILLRAVGDEAASEVLRNMTDEEVQHLGNYMANMGPVEPETVEKVMQEFLGGAAGTDGLSSGDSELVKKILEKAFGRDKAENVVANLSVPTEEAGLETLKFLDAQTIANFLRNEHPQTIALILAHLEPTQAGVVLGLLPEGVRGDVAYRMATLERIPPGVISELDLILSNELTASGTVQSSVVGGAKPVAEMLNQMDRANEAAILGRINEMNPELAERIKQMMFTFDDLANIDDRGMQTIL